jgi:glycosyltransferase involved in cell wall biosynthesis
MPTSETPKISVVIYSYNFERFLKESIESILAQTLLPYEILICDDHSTDKSWDIICKYSENYSELIKSYRHKKNIGMIANGDFGFKKIKGELISWIDGDDRWLPTKLELEWKALRNYPDAKIAYSNVYIIDFHGNRKLIWDDGKSTSPPTGDAFVQVFSRRFFPNSTSVYRNDLMYRSVFNEIGYLDKNLKIYVDWDLKIRATAKFPIVYSGVPLVEYRVHKQGISNSPREVLYRDMIQVYEKNIHLANSRSWNEIEAIRDGVEQQLKAIMPGKTTKLKVPALGENIKITNHLDKPYPPVEIIKEREKPKRKHPPNIWVGENLIFLISQPRAGSTLLQRILNGHPYIHTTAEPWIMLHPLYALKEKGLFAEFDSNLARQGLEDFTSQVPEGKDLYIEALRQMGGKLYNRVLEVSGKQIFLDKTPRYHFIIPELQKVFPEAKFIILLRNPMAVLTSTLKAWFQNDPENLQKSQNYLDVLQGP